MKKLIAALAVACFAIGGCQIAMDPSAAVADFDTTAGAAFRYPGQYVIMRPGKVWSVRSYEIPETAIRPSAMPGATTVVSQVTIIDRK